MSETSDRAQRIIEAGTPDRCIGCHTPLLKGFHLEEQVSAGEISEEEAASQLRAELEETCKYGRVTDRALGSRCMNLVVCKPSAVPIPPKNLRWDWDTAEI